MVIKETAITFRIAFILLLLLVAPGIRVVISAPNADVDLAITKTDSTDPVVAGDALSYQISVTNTGPSIATGVVISDTLSGGVTYTSASTGCTYNGASRTVSCGLGEVGVGSITTATIGVLVNASTTGILLNRATVSTADTDTNTNNDASQATTTVTTSSNLNLAMTAPASIIAGDVLTYTLSISNTGPSDASGITLEDDFPVGSIYVASSIACSQLGNRLTCNAGNLAANASATVRITFRINSSRTQALTNDARVSATTPDPDTTNNDASTTTPVIVSSDMTISKNGAPDTIAPGELLTYTITTRNSGLSDGHGVTLTDALPTQVLFQSYTSTKGTCTGTSTITCAPGSVTSGEIITVTLAVMVDPSESPGTITNTVNVVSTSTDPNLTNNSATERTTLTNRTADLRVIKHDSIDPAVAGEVLTYTITVSNTGPSTASGVIVTDTLPINVTLQSLAASQGTCTGTRCALGTISVTSSAMITVAVNVNPSVTGVITNSASVSANEADLLINNNNTHERTTIIAEADLSVEKTGSPEPVFAGKSLNYLLHINNHGPSRANGVHVVDDLPGDASFVSAPAGCIHSSGSVDCSLGGLSPNSSREITITVQVNLTASGLINNTASISSTATDRVQSNNQSEWTSTILEPDFQIPTVTWAQPVLTGQRYDVGCQMVHLQASATDNLAVQSVRFYRWDPYAGALGGYIDIGYDYSAPYQWDLSTCSLAAKWNQIFAQSQDTYGNLSIRQYIWLYRHIVFLPIIGR